MRVRHRLAEQGSIRLGRVGERGDRVQRRVGLERAADRTGAARCTGQVVDRRQERGDDVVPGDHAVVGAHARVRDVEVLRRGAHLAAEERETAGERAHGRRQVGNGIEDDGVDARGLGEHQGVRDVAFQPRSERGTAGEVDDPHFGTGGQLPSDGGVGGVDDQLNGVGGQLRLDQHLAQHAHRERGRQDRAGVRLDQHRIARREVGQNRRIGVPGGERGAGDDECGAERADPETLAQGHLRLAESLLPGHLSGHPGHGRPGRRYGFQAAVEGVGPASAARHGQALPGGVRGDRRELLATLVDPVQRLQAHAEPAFDAGVAQGGGGGRRAHERLVHRRRAVADIERLPGVRGDLVGGDHRAGGRRQRQGGAVVGAE